MAKGGRGMWKLILFEVGMAVLAVLGKEMAERASDYLDEKSKKRKEEAKRKEDEPEDPSEEEKESKNEGENGIS